MAGPALKITVSRKTERGAPRDKPTPILAVWDNDGKLSGSIEKGVRIWIEIDGRKGEITAGKTGSHWINVHDNREAPRPAANGASDGPTDDELLEF